MIMSKLQDVLDLLRTGTAPMSFGMTEQQWLQHKVNKACAELQAILDEMHNEIMMYDDFVNSYPGVQERD